MPCISAAWEPLNVHLRDDFLSWTSRNHPGLATCRRIGWSSLQRQQPRIIRKGRRLELGRRIIHLRSSLAQLRTPPPWPRGPFSAVTIISNMSDQLLEQVRDAVEGQIVRCCRAVYSRSSTKQSLQDFEGQRLAEMLTTVMLGGFGVRGSPLSASLVFY